LHLELGDLRAASVDLSLTGFDDDEINKLLAGEELVEALEEGEAPAPPKKPITKPGDVWRLGAHRLAAEIATWDHLANGRVNVAVGSGWMPEEFEAASAAHIYDKRNKHVIETIEIMKGVWTNDLFEYHGEFASFEKCGFGAKPVQKPHPPIFLSGLRDAKRMAKRVAKYGLAGWIGIQDTPDDIKQCRAAIQAGLSSSGARARSTISRSRA